VEFGDWTGAAFAALVGDERWRRYNAVRSLTSPPNGELMLQVQARAVKTILDLRLAQVDGHVAVVSHGDVIRALLMYFLGVPLDFVHRLDVAPARISVVVLSDEGVRVPQVNGDTVP
jgi:probable phosphoglycerate mutase